ncbi:variant erythrocyte surface antigen-1 family protein [Babesia caballi]|uniref:Variant erythrocyte surface antigen-1 family protein n=1 Tax=Babesia caballi TaxID=5871 RepID=A0AAV4LN67_BABCB|nr:variant erythrocyte surface antigen-1 family protein [Babesia caballi]
MAAPEKKLTEPPEDLKEAIDWVLRVSGGDSHSMISMPLFMDALDGVLKYSYHISDSEIGKLLTEVKKDKDQFTDGPITAVAKALRTFIGYGYKSEESNNKWKIVDTGIVQKGDINSVYTSSYQGSWSKDVYSGDFNNSKRKRGVHSFFTAIEKIYEGLTELYYNCKKDWKNENLGGTSGEGLKQFMEKNGFDTAKLNTSMKGDIITSQAFQDLNEFTTAYSGAGENPSLDAFRYQLEQNAWSKPSASPLSALYILATHAYVQSTSAATPSFLGYSGTAALAGGAYGLNLGGLGTFMSAFLA